MLLCPKLSGLFPALWKNNKAEVTALVEQFENLEMVCNARVDTALYGLPPASTGKRNRPRKRGNRIPLDEIALDEPKNGD